MGSRIRTGNRILDELGDEEFSRLEPGLETYVLNEMETLFGPDHPGSRAYFPTSGVISFLRGFRDGSQIEVGVVGREGMAGVHAFLGSGLEPMRAVVQYRGAAYRLDKALLEEEFGRAGKLQQLLLGFTYTLLSQISLTAACNQLHTVDQRLARWLLAMSDRAETAEIALSHEFLAHMLGTTRARVTEGIGRFRSRDGVRNGRGRIVIENRAVLEQFACECYDELREVYGREASSASRG